MSSLKSAAERESLELRIGAALGARDWNAATTLVLEGYGEEVFTFLAAIHFDATDEVFSLFAEGLWRSAGSFEQRSSARTWAYAIARRVSGQYRRNAKRRAERFQPFPEDSELSALEAQIRSQTMSFLRTEARTRLTALRDDLPPDDRILLMLRVDRKLAWDELALVLMERPDGDIPEEDLRREMGRLRKRFQLVKAKLREAARAAGLLGSER